MPAPTTSYARFLRLLSGGLVVGLALICAVTAIVDPYSAFGWVRIPGFNAYKIDVGNDRLVKANIMARTQYDGVILGTSQAQFGIDPESPALEVLGKRFYNAGLLSTTPYQMMRYLQHAVGTNDIRAAVVVVDLLMFTENPLPAMLASFSEKRLSLAADGTPQPRLLDPDFVNQVLSFDALRMSLATVRKQRPEHQQLLDNGLRSPANLEHELASKGGMRAAFHESEHAYLQSYGRFRLFDEQGRSRALRELEDLVAYARSQDIQLLLLFPPGHARQLGVLRACGQLENLERLKREIVAILDREAAKSGAAPYPLWDFGGVSGPTSEEVPEASDVNSRMRWYYDTAHFRPALGALALARALGHAEASAAPADFGVRLTSDSLEHALHDARSAFERYVRSHPADIEEIQHIQGELSRNALARNP